MWAIAEPSGPMENGTTYMVRPRMQPAKRPVEEGAHLGRVTPVVGRSGVDLLLGTDVGPVLDPGHVTGVGMGPVAVGSLGVGQLGERAALDQGLTQAVVLVGGTVAPLDAVGRRELGDPIDPGEEFGVRSGGHGERGLLLLPVLPAGMCGVQC